MANITQLKSFTKFLLVEKLSPKKSPEKSLHLFKTSKTAKLSWSSSKIQRSGWSNCRSNILNCRPFDLPSKFHCTLSVKLFQIGTFITEILYVIIIHRVLWKWNSVKSGKGVTSIPPTIKFKSVDFFFYLW